MSFNFGIFFKYIIWDKLDKCRFFCILIAASAPNNETTSDSTYTTKTWSILSKTGVELCVIGDKLKFQNYEQILKDLLEQSQIKARDARIDNNPRLAIKVNL